MTIAPLEVGANYVESTAAIMSQQLSTQRRIEEIKSELLTELNRVSNNVTRQLRNVHAAVKRIAAQPIVRAVWSQSSRSNTGNSDENVDRTEGEGVQIPQVARARLYKRPQSLYDLWHEYEFGISGNKAAKDFTRVERGNVKFAYCRRKVFWDVIVKLVNAGHTSDTAVDQVYNAYGRNLPVTTILRRMVHDRKDGGHPNLRI